MKSTENESNDNDHAKDLVEASFTQLLPNNESGSTNSKQLQPAVNVNATTLSPSAESAE